MKKRILLDMDAVITNFNPRVVAYLNRVAGHDAFFYEQLTHFDFDKCWGKMWGRLALDYINRDEIYDGLEPEPMAIEMTRALEAFYDVLVVSSPLSGHVAGKFKWLLGHGFKHRQIVLTSNKSAVSGDLLVDDAIKNLRAWDGPALVYDQPWNQGYSPKRVVRVHNWQEVFAASRRILG